MFDEKRGIFRKEYQHLAEKRVADLHEKKKTYGIPSLYCQEIVGMSRSWVKAGITNLRSRIYSVISEICLTKRSLR